MASAGVARDVLAQARDDLLRRHPWNFAMTRARLAQLATAPAFEFSCAYTIPPDCLRVVSVHDSDAGGGDLEYKIEGLDQGDDGYVNAVLTNATACYLRYVRQVTNPSLMTTTFRQVLILRLAMIFATGIANSSSLRDRLKEDMRDAMRQAASIDGIEDFPDRLPEGSWATSRRAYGWSSGRSRWS